MTQFKFTVRSTVFDAVDPALVINYTFVKQNPPLLCPLQHLQVTQRGITITKKQ